MTANLPRWYLLLAPLLFFYAPLAQFDLDQRLWSSSGPFDNEKFNVLHSQRENTHISWEDIKFLSLENATGWTYAWAVRESIKKHFDFCVDADCPTIGSLGLLNEAEAETVAVLQYGGNSSSAIPFLEGFQAFSEILITGLISIQHLITAFEMLTFLEFVRRAMLAVKNRISHLIKKELKEKANELSKELQKYVRTESDLKEKIKCLEEKLKQSENMAFAKEEENEKLRVKNRTSELIKVELAEKTNGLFKEIQKYVHIESDLKEKIKCLEENLKQSENLVFAKEEENEELKDSLSACQRRSANMAEELYGLKITIDYEQKHHKEEMDSLKEEMKNLTEQQTASQQMETTLREKLEHEEAKIKQLSEEFKVYKQGVLEDIEKEKNKAESLNSQISFHVQRADQNWMALSASEHDLNKEKKETDSLRKKLAELNKELEEFKQPVSGPLPGQPATPPPAKDVPAPLHIGKIRQLHLRTRRQRRTR